MRGWRWKRKEVRSESQKADTPTLTLLLRCLSLIPISFCILVAYIDDPEVYRLATTSVTLTASPQEAVQLCVFKGFTKMKSWHETSESHGGTCCMDRRAQKNFDGNLS